ncbi:MAG: hypothetical protein RI953_1576 [Pseudomonadota bacterium]|jgi:flagellar motility protein MotE (MotC chaperone)
MKALHLLFGAKAVALMGLGGFMYANYQAKAQSQTETVAEEAKKDEGKAAIPEIPEKGLTLSKAAELRNQLLLMRKDIEQKTEKLNVAKQGYDRSKTDIENKLRRIEEERKLLEETLQKERKAKEERLSEALEFVAKMEPKKAAPLLESMDRDLVMQLLRKLPPRQVTKLLEAVNPKKATELLEYYTRIRSGREYELFRELGLCQGNGGDESGNEKPANEKSGAAQPNGSGGAPALPGGAPAASVGGDSKSAAAAGAAPTPVGSPAAAATGSESGDKSKTAAAPLPAGTPAAAAQGASAEPTTVR